MSRGLGECQELVVVEPEFEEVVGVVVAVVVVVGVATGELGVLTGGVATTVGVDAAGTVGTTVALDAVSTGAEAKVAAGVADSSTPNAANNA
jgi:hypothetical protein